MSAAEDDEEVLKQKFEMVYKAWLEKRCFNGWYPDTSQYDYCIAPKEAERRGVSIYQVLLEHYTESEAQLGMALARFTHQATGAYCVRYR
jgi:hypothetical protein